MEFKKEYLTESGLRIITGKSGSGKTSWCKRFAGFVSDSGLMPCGIISLPVYKDLAKTGIQVLNISTGDTRQLAFLNSHNCMLSAHRTDNWNIAESALHWANCVLSEAQGDILIIDEIGILEFRRNSGFTEAMRILDSSEFSRVFVSVRLSCIENAVNRWPHAVILEVNDENPGKK